MASTHIFSMKYTGVVLYLFFALNLSAKDTTTPDSLIYYLNQITGSEKTDTTVLRKMRAPQNRITPAALANPAFLEAMKRVKGVLNADKYYSLSQQFLTYACYNSTSGEYDYPINYGLHFIEELKDYKSLRQKYALLSGLRDMRVPFRNSARIYEGIETYSKLSSYFYQRNDSASVSIADNVLASFYNTLGLSDRAIYFQSRSIDFLNDHITPPDSTYLGYGYGPNIGLYGKINRKSVLGSYYIDDDNPEKALQQIYDVFTLSKKSDNADDVRESSFVYLQIARAHILLKTDSADYYLNKMRESIDSIRNFPYEFAHYYQARAFGYYMADNLDSADVYISKCIRLIEEKQLPFTSIMGSLSPAYYLALIRIRENRPKEAIAQLIPEIDLLKSLNLRKETLRELKLLANAYNLDKDYNQATSTWERYDALLSEMISSEKNNRSLSFEIEKRMAENERAVQLLEAENKYSHKRQYYLLGILGLLILLAFGLLTRNRFKQKVNQELKRKNKEIESTLTKLQSTQALLVQSEKMASLGELTAGIAHEIQNPLNFVNNFSEVNTELIDELQHELKSGHTAEAITISNNIKENEEKITFHGKRADAIVKGMLQHSRSSSGVKEPTDINALADEYLRLAYHGLRAKDKSFNATMKTDYDDSIGMVDVLPQDIGRVILNLITNAFYAVSIKQKSLQTTNPLKGSDDYQPTVTITTRILKSPIGDLGVKQAEISVSDNGSGIPKSVLDKIFQPFFTTKPTGQGTGLGLSLSYDIVKAHGGEIKVETKEGVGTTFTILLPQS